jgi:hypothetical protein
MSGSFIQVVGIEKRCEVGTCISRPFKVQAEDGHTYWLKGLGTGWSRRELCHELLAARLAVACGLPVAPVEVLEVPKAILEFSAVPEIEALRAGPAFGSRHVPDSASLLPVAVGRVPEEVRWRILLFDWWIQNGDRILGELGGNVNLLWNPDGERLSVIDHNNAFDRDFDETAFFHDHVFRAERRRIPEPFLLDQVQLFASIFARFSALTGDFPEEWTERQDNAGDFDPELAIAILKRYVIILTTFGGAS